MSLLHSFYCWEHLAVMLVSTTFFTLFGIENWRILTLMWVDVQHGSKLAAAVFSVLMLMGLAAMSRNGSSGEI